MLVMNSSAIPNDAALLEKTGWSSTARTGVIVVQTIFVVLSMYLFLSVVCFFMLRFVEESSKYNGNIIFFSVFCQI